MSNCLFFGIFVSKMKCCVWEGDGCHDNKKDTQQ
ncbi:MAG: hypothetical protein H6Q69_684 [Firmicutes bacterium]|nr:hypothetical protein [Bacillota bacterium]